MKKQIMAVLMALALTGAGVGLFESAADARDRNGRNNKGRNGAKVSARAKASNRGQNGRNTIRGGGDTEVNQGAFGGDSGDARGGDARGGDASIETDGMQCLATDIEESFYLACNVVVLGQAGGEATGGEATTGAGGEATDNDTFDCDADAGPGAPPGDGVPLGGGFDRDGDANANCDNSIDVGDGGIEDNDEQESDAVAGVNDTDIDED